MPSYILSPLDCIDEHIAEEYLSKISSITASSKSRRDFLVLVNFVYYLRIPHCLIHYMGKEFFVILMKLLLSIRAIRHLIASVDTTHCKVIIINHFWL
ncbi:hypothetical protein X975_24620, partial [Stegodyphus mimosarum]